MPLAAGDFDLDDYIDAMRDMFRHFGGDVHVFAVCQPSVPVLAAVALMEADGDRTCRSRMILAGGPIDTRVSPTHRQPARRCSAAPTGSAATSSPTCRGRARASGASVYPGFLQLIGLHDHEPRPAHERPQGPVRPPRRGDGDSAEKHREFYDEYLAVMDLTAEFYLQTRRHRVRAPPAAARADDASRPARRPDPHQPRRR